MQEDLIKILENAPLSKPIDIEPLRHRARVSQTVNRVLTAPIFKKGV